jgi:hypothetical protein
MRPVLLCLTLAVIPIFEPTEGWSFTVRACQAQIVFAHEALMASNGGTTL